MAPVQTMGGSTRSVRFVPVSRLPKTCCTTLTLLLAALSCFGTGNAFDSTRCMACSAVTVRTFVVKNKLDTGVSANHGCGDISAVRAEGQATERKTAESSGHEASAGLRRQEIRKDYRLQVSQAGLLFFLLQDTVAECVKPLRLS